MTPPSNVLPPFPARRAVALLGCVTGVTVAACCVVLLVLGHPSQLLPAAACAGLCMLAAVGSLDVVRRASAVNLQRVAMAAMLAFPLRLAVVALGVGVLAVCLPGAVVPLVLWALFFYLVLLGVEVAVVVSYVKDAAPPLGTPSTTAAKGSASHV